MELLTLKKLDKAISSINISPIIINDDKITNEAFAKALKKQKHLLQELLKNPDIITKHEYIDIDGTKFPVIKTRSI